jgi:hypothetical protein
MVRTIVGGSIATTLDSSPWLMGAPLRGTRL